MRPLPLLLGLAVLALPALSSAQTAPAREPAEPRSLCTHATGWAPGDCARPGAMPSPQVRMRYEMQNGRLEVLDQVNAAIAQGRCADARRIAVDKGEHAMAAQVRKACKGKV
ncbi:hypothetical protein [Phenylobacterium sp.]|jgi:hypothetical protein|uniref:hypothetical protein n=1 Tax=Phenylobacterium sp. TaxID=1871053 RepID=UPI002F956A9A